MANQEMRDTMAFLIDAAEQLMDSLDRKDMLGEQYSKEYLRRAIRRARKDFYGPEHPPCSACAERHEG